MPDPERLLRFVAEHVALVPGLLVKGVVARFEGLLSAFYMHRTNWPAVILAESDAAIAAAVIVISEEEPYPKKDDGAKEEYHSNCPSSP